MNSAVITLMEQLESSLPEIMGSDNVLSDAEAAIHAVEDCLHQMRRLLLQTSRDKEEERHFYKIISPQLYSYLIYYVRIYLLESNSPPTFYGKQKVFEQELKLIEDFFDANRDAYRYYRTGDSSLDHALFQNQRNLRSVIIEELACFLDQTICTHMGLKFARFKAYERLIDYISLRLGDDEGRKGQHDFALPDGGKIQWTDKKIHLQELLYALVYSNSINNGNISIKSLAKIFGSVFNIDLSNIHRSKQDMYTRRNTAAYMDFLTRSFKKGVDDADDRNNF